MKIGSLLGIAAIRYLFAFALVAGAFVVRLWLQPLSGTGAPFVLFFAVVLVSSLFAGIGPGIFSLLLSLPLAAYMFVVRAGYTIGQASVQSLLFAVDGLVVVYLTTSLNERRRERDHLLALEEMARKRAEGTSERLRESEEAIRRSETQFRRLIEQMPDGVFAYQGGHVVYANVAFARLLGYDDPAAMVGLTIDHMLHPDERAAVAERVRKLEQSGAPAPPRESRMACRDGSYRSVETVGMVLPFAGQTGIIVVVRDLSERKRTEEALRISEALFSGITGISADAIICVDDDQRITVFNNGAEKIFGYSKAEMIGSPLAILIPERFRSIHFDHVEKFAAGQEVARRMGNRGSAIFGVRKNGDEFPADAAISKLDVGGRRILTVALRDVTEQKRAQDDLRQSQERFELALKGADLASWDWNITTGEVVFNRRWAEMRGFQPDEVRPCVDSWTSGIHPEDRARVDKALADHFQGRSSEYAAEFRVRTKTGKWLWILDRGKVFARDEAGQPTRMAGTELDITERKRTEAIQQFLVEAGEALGATLDYEQTLATVARLAVRDFADCCIVDVVGERGQLKRVKVAAREPAKGAVCSQLEHIPLDRRRLFLTRSALETKRPLLIERLTPQDLETFAQSPEHLQLLSALDAHSLMAVPLLMHGEILGALAFVLSDPTRAYEQSDLHIGQALADRAAVAIDNARLYQASVQATQLRDQVLGVVAHDLRNPLSTIQLQASTLRRKDMHPERRSQRATESILRSATRMDRLIRDLLDVALMEAGKLTIDRAPLPGDGVVMEAVDAQKTLASASSLQIQLEVEREVPAILADRDRLLQVFENLIGNAIKFTPSGGRVTVGATARPREVVFWVADTGAGIAPEALPRVFDRFWQATKADRRGAGLGLPICKGIVEAHGGRIWAESKLGEGTTFFFAIPRVSSVNERPEATVS